MTYLSVFILAAGLNWVLAAWAASCVKQHATAAATYAGVITGINITVMGHALTDTDLAAAAVVGAFVGCYVNVLLASRRVRAKVPAGYRSKYGEDF